MSKGKKILIGIIIAALAAAAFIVYFAVIPGLRTFSEGTTINGTDVSGMTLSQAKDTLSSQYADYSLKIDFINETEYISSDSVDMKLNPDADLKSLLDAQANGTSESNQYIVENLYTYDSEKLDEIIMNYPALDESNMADGEDGTLSYNTDKGEFEIIGGETGTRLDPVTVKSAIGEAVSSLTPELDVTAAGLYSGSELTADSQTGREALETANKYISASLVYTFKDDQTETIDKDLISQWVMIDSDKQAVLDPDRVQSSLNEIAERHGGDQTTVDFKTTAGDTIELNVETGGSSLDINSLYEDVTSKVTAGESGEYDAPYTSTDDSEYADNFGGSYVEVDLDNQIVYLYKDGTLVDSASCVSGCVLTTRMTPDGVFKINGMCRDVTLVGDDYESPVSYWMPFYGSYGLHDASWRSTFGGDIYLRNGSHGCVNLPTDFAAEVYETVENGWFVIIYGGVKTIDGQYVPASSTKTDDTDTTTDSDDTSTTSETSAPETSAPETSAPETSAPETSAPETSAPETSAPETSAPETTAPETTAPDTTES